MFFDSGHMVFGFVFVFGGSNLGNDIDPTLSSWNDVRN